MRRLLSWLREPPEGTLTVEGAPELWYELGAALRPWPRRAKATVKLARAAKAPAAVKVGDDFVFEREVIAPLVPDGTAVLRDVALTAKGKEVPGDFVLLDVQAHAPLDRSASRAQWRDGWLSRLEVVGWGSERVPRAALFRVGETLNELAVSEELGARLAEATGGRVGVRGVEPSELQQRSVHTVHPAATPPRDGSKDQAAEAAYWKLETGRGTAKDRAVACSSAAFAYWLARTVDGRARPDTRAAVLKEPAYAALYAVYVEKKASREMERAVASSWFGARLYLAHLCKDVPAAFEQLLRESGTEVAEERQQVKRLAAFRK